MRMRNATDRVLRFEIAGAPAEEPTRYELQPGDVCDVADGYCVVANGGRSIISMIAPGLEQYTETETAAVSGTEVGQVDVTAPTAVEPEPGEKPRRRRRT